MKWEKQTFWQHRLADRSCFPAKSRQYAKRPQISWCSLLQLEMVLLTLRQNLASRQLTLLEKLLRIFHFQFHGMWLRFQQLPLSKKLQQSLRQQQQMLLWAVSTALTAIWAVSTAPAAIWT